MCTRKNRNGLRRHTMSTARTYPRVTAGGSHVKTAMTSWHGILNLEGTLQVQSMTPPCPSASAMWILTLLPYLLRPCSWTRKIPSPKSLTCLLQMREHATSRRTHKERAPIKRNRRHAGELGPTGGTGGGHYRTDKMRQQRTNGQNWRRAELALTSSGVKWFKHLWADPSNAHTSAQRHQMQ